MPRNSTVVDFIARGKSSDEWNMVLVEEGPWRHSIENELRRLQDRLYDCIDIALDGRLAEKYPDAYGKKIIIQLDCYNVPKEEVSQFFEKFSEGVFLTPEYRDDLEKSPFVQQIALELNLDSIN